MSLKSASPPVRSWWKMFIVHVVPLFAGTEIIVSVGRYSIFFWSGGFNQKTMVNSAEFGGSWSVLANERPPNAPHLGKAPGHSPPLLTACQQRLRSRARRLSMRVQASELASRRSVADAAVRFGYLVYTERGFVY